MSRLKKIDTPFTQIPNKLLTSGLTMKAIGIYVFMRSKPDGWNFTLISMAQQMVEGVDAVSSGIKELRNSGWIEYEKHSDGTGEYFLNIEVFGKDIEEPKRDNPKLGKPTRISNKDKTSKKKESVKKDEEYTEFFNNDLWRDYGIRARKDDFQIGDKRKAFIAYRKLKEFGTDAELRILLEKEVAKKYGKRHMSTVFNAKYKELS